MTRSRQSGFSLIETLVAVGIVAIALVPIMSLEIQLQRGFVEQRARLSELQTQRNALALLRDFNFTETPSGRLPLGVGQTLTWRATALSQPIRTTRFPRGEGEFEVVLWRVEAEVVGPGEQRVRFNVEKLGWRRLIDPV